MNKVPMIIYLSIRKSTELLAFIYGFDQMDRAFLQMRKMFANFILERHFSQIDILDHVFASCCSHHSQGTPTDPSFDHNVLREN